MDFIPFNCESVAGSNRIQTRDEYSGGTKKKRPIGDDNQVVT